VVSALESGPRCRHFLRAARHVVVLHTTPPNSLPDMWGTHNRVVCEANLHNVQANDSVPEWEQFGSFFNTWAWGHFKAVDLVINEQKNASREVPRTAGALASLSSSGSLAGFAVVGRARSPLKHCRDAVSNGIPGVGDKQMTR